MAIPEIYFPVSQDARMDNPYGLSIADRGAYRQSKDIVLDL